NLEAAANEASKHFENAERMIARSLKNHVPGMNLSEEPSQGLSEVIRRIADQFMRDAGIEIDTARLKGRGMVTQVPTIDQLPNKQILESDVVTRLRISYPTT